MAKPSHYLITFSGIHGSVNAPAEEWAFTIKSGGLAIPETVAGLQQPADELSLLYATQLAGLFRTDQTLTRVRIAAFDGNTQRTALDGNGAYMQADADTPRPGIVVPSTSNRMPIQTSLCVSLDTARAGARGRGRFFLPWPAVGIEADFRISTVSRDLVADAVQAFLDGINNIGLPGESNLQVSVVSSFGHITPVTGCRVGRVPDTMRSRRGDLLEDYVERVVTS